MKSYSFHPLVLAIGMAGFSAVAFAQTPPPANPPTDGSASSQSAQPVDPSQPTDAMSPATPPDPAVDPSPAAPTVPPDSSMDPATPPSPDPAIATPPPPPVDAINDDREERHGGFQWGLLGLLGLLGLIPRKPKVETYAVRDTTTRTGAGYDSSRTP